jgi:hypothetical protein
MVVLGMAVAPQGASWQKNAICEIKEICEKGSRFDPAMPLKPERLPAGGFRAAVRRAEGTLSA